MAALIFDKNGNISVKSSFTQEDGLKLVDNPRYRDLNGYDPIIDGIKSVLGNDGYSKITNELGREPIFKSILIDDTEFKNQIIINLTAESIFRFIYGDVGTLYGTIVLLEIKP